MPTYQYACMECDHSFEQVQSFTEDSLTVCPQCEGRLRKVFNAVGVVFKGSGFYRTDSRTDSRNGSSNGSGNGSGNGKASSDSGSSSGSSDAGSSSAGNGNGSASSGASSTSKAGATSAA